MGTERVIKRGCIRRLEPGKKQTANYLSRFITRSPKLERHLDKRLSAQKREGKIQSEQWYRIPRWLTITAMANPYNTIFNELEIIMESFPNAIPSLGDHGPLVFFGVGTGDTEIALVDRMIRSKDSLQVYAIDVQELFLKMFAQSCLNLLKNEQFRSEVEKQMYFRGYSTLFEDLSRKDLCLPMQGSSASTTEGSVHIALGSVVGNFEDQEGTLSMFKRLGAETLVLGVHTAKSKEELEFIASLYDGNEIINDLVLAPYGIEEGERPAVSWEIDTETNAVRAFVGSTQLFYSKKYNLDELIANLSAIGFEPIEIFSKEQAAVCIFKKMR